MSAQTLQQIYFIIKSYVDQKKQHPDYVDFYALYDIDQAKNVNELKPDIRRVRKLFHPDQIGYIDKNFHDIYNEIINKNKELFEMENNERKKQEYDGFLNYKKKSNNDSINNNQFAQDADIIKDFNYIQSAIETMIIKYGFYQAYESFCRMLRGDFSGITRENSARERMRNMGVKNINQIVINLNKSANIFDNVMDLFLTVMNKNNIEERANDFYSSCDKINREDKNNYNVLFDLIKDKCFNINSTASAFLDKKYSQTVGTSAEFSSKDLIFLMYAKVHKFRNGNNDMSFSRLKRFESENNFDYLISNYCQVVNSMNETYSQSY